MTNSNTSQSYEYRFLKREEAFYFSLFFLLNSLEMLLELVASRVMSPYFGNSTFVWTAIIGIILLSASFGNLIGGNLSEKKKVSETLYIILLFCAISVAIIPKLSDFINPLLSYFDIRIGVLISSATLFLLPSILLSIGTPLLMKSILSQTDTIGDYSGKIHSLIAIGSLFGTFVGGFILIPKLGTSHILYFIAFLLALLSIISTPRDLNNKSKILILVAICIFLSFIFIPEREDLTKGVSIDTEYSRIIILDTMLNDRPVRLYKSSGAYSSGMYLDNNTDLTSDYLKCYNDSFQYNKNIKNVLMIGGAAYAYPKYWISHTDKKMTVVEIDPMAEKIARKYFDLTEVINQYDKNHKKLKLLTQDGRVFLNKNTETFDAIFNDAFSGAIPVGTLATKEAVQDIYNSLSDDGIYMSNVLGTPNSQFLLSEMNTINSVFPYVYIYRADKSEKRDYGNYIVIGSKKPLSNDLFLKVDYKSHIILTDNYAPVEQMVGDSYYTRK